MPKQIEPCMFCGELPCACAGAKVKKSSARKKVTSSSTSPAPVVQESSVGSVTPLMASPSVDIKSAMRAQIRKPRTVETVQLSVAPSQAHQAMEQAAHDNMDELREVHEAIRALAPLLHPTELDKHESIIGPTVRAAAWKERLGGRVST